MSDVPCSAVDAVVGVQVASKPLIAAFSNADVLGGNAGALPLDLIAALSMLPLFSHNRSTHKANHLGRLRHSAFQPLEQAHALHVALTL